MRLRNADKHTLFAASLALLRTLQSNSFCKRMPYCIVDAVNPDANKKVEKQSVMAVGDQAGTNAAEERPLMLLRSADGALAKLDPSDPGKIGSKKKSTHAESGIAHWILQFASSALRLPMLSYQWT